MVMRAAAAAKSEPTMLWGGRERRGGERGEREGGGGEMEKCGMFQYFSQDGDHLPLTAIIPTEKAFITNNAGNAGNLALPRLYPL